MNRPVVVDIYQVINQSQMINSNMGVFQRFWDIFELKIYEHIGRCRYSKETTALLNTINVKIFFMLFSSDHHISFVAGFTNQQT